MFSTSLSRITHLIRTKDITNALEKISGSVLGWSGGTNIGRSLQTFNRNFAPSVVTHRTVVVIISDGWDRGDVSLLERQMQDLKRRCKKIIWLNPLLGETTSPCAKACKARCRWTCFCPFITSTVWSPWAGRCRSLWLSVTRITFNIRRSIHARSRNMF